MRGTWKAWMVAGLLLLPAACGSMMPGEQEPPADEVAESGGAAQVGDAAGEPAADAESDASAADETTEGADAADAADEAPAEADAGPTLSADEVDLIQSFRPPSKGSADALVTIYQFSDYI